MKIMKISSVWICAAIAVGLSLAASGHPGAQAQEAARHARPETLTLGGQVFYEIFVRSFQDSNGDGIGDLDGVTSRLDYLSALGVAGIWLTPIFPSPSYHGYDATDYRSVNNDYGGMPALQRLLAEAHRRGLKILLDIAVNHTSSQHPWFLNSQQGASSPLRSRYLWSDYDPQWSEAPGKWYPGQQGSLYYSSFSPGMPDLNWRDGQTLEEVKDLLRFWKQQGVDGFRLDAARYYAKGPEGQSDTPATHAAIAAFAGEIRAEFPDAFFVGEVWADWPTIFPYIQNGEQLDSAFAFPLAGGLLEALKARTPAPLAQAIDELVASGVAVNRVSPFTTNHDMDRISTQLGDRSAKGSRKKSRGTDPRLQLAAATLFALPGTPFIYYGEEIGMTNGNGTAFAGDLAKRTPMQWTATANHGFTGVATKPWLGFSSDSSAITVQSQSADPASLLNTYRTLIAVRHGSAALCAGNLEPIDTQAQPPLTAFARRLANGQVAVFVGNFSTYSIPATTLKLAAGGNAAFSYQQLWGSGGFTAAREPGAIDLNLPNLPPWGSLIVSFTPN